jgi:hypothetical protein
MRKMERSGEMEKMDQTVVEAVESAQDLLDWTKT